MRRKDREVTDDYQIDTIITSCNCCRLGFYDQDSVYIVPLSFGYEKKAGTRIFYFHSAKQGKKIQLMKTNARVGFEWIQAIDYRRERLHVNIPPDSKA